VRPSQTDWKDVPVKTAPLTLWLGIACALACADAPDTAPPDAAKPAETAARDAEASGGDAAAPSGLPADAIHVEPAVILDATGFEAPIAAATLFLPRGWQTQGGVEWGAHHLCTNGYALDWSARSPDGADAIAVLPQLRWESNNYGAPASAPGCPLAPYTNVRQVLEAIAQQRLPGARVSGYRPREDIRADLARLEAVAPMPLGESRTWVEAGELSLEYEQDGRAMRATLAAAAVFSLMRTNAGMGTMDALTGSTFPAYLASAPAGTFDARVFEALRRSIRTAPQWEARIANHNAAIGRVALEESRKRSAAIARSNDEIARIRSEAWATQQESADRRAREFGELMRGVETYDDADAPGGQTELSAHYDAAWRLNDGSYVLTNDPNFDPWRDLQVEGKKLDPTR
jgi:hypothetical protein